MAVLSRKTLKKLHFLRFSEKRPITGNFSKFCSDRFYLHADRRVVFKFRKIWPTGSRSNLALLTSQNYKCMAEPSGSPPGPPHAQCYAARRRHPSPAMDSSCLLLARRYLQQGRSIPSTLRGSSECTALFLFLVTFTFDL